MRNNQPITNTEYKIPEGVTLVSKTDLVGNIIECNEAFQLVSGYSRAELIGQPHNLVRHPDIPEAVFADLWKALKKGHTWSQVVKNRRANGDHYWVRANATPIYTDGKISGYMSIRTPVTEAEKTATAQAYKDINAGKAKIKNGRVYTGFDWHKLKAFSRLAPQYQLTLLIGLLYLAPYITYSVIVGHSLLEQIAVGVIGLIPPFIYGYRLKKGNLRSEEQLFKVASGDQLSNDWFDPETNEGKRQTAIKSVYLASNEKTEDALFKLDKSQQLQTAMDQVSSNIMIADAKLEISYMNNDMKHFFVDRKSEFDKAVPGFDANNLIGQDIDVFHANNPDYPRGILSKLTEPYTGQFNMGNIRIEVYAIPVFNHAGQRTATIAEWRDKTAEAQLLEQVGSTVADAQAGILSSRIDLSLVEGVTKELSVSINDLIEAIEKPIDEAVQVAVALSEGDLTKQVSGKYQGRFAVLQDSLNVAVNSLSSMMAQTKSAVHAVSGGAEQIYQGSIDLNDRTQSQAASLEETASSMEEMTSTVKQNASNAQQASEVTQKTSEQAKSGVVVMHSAIQSMEQINESSQKINDIIALIDSIAFQTNLLALNAAVEAARAGEHGRGFAVVAGEVRNLAGKSSDAAKDIRDLIEDTVKKVSEGTHHVKGSGDALNEIVESIDNVNQIIEEIASSSNEQSEGVSLVNSSITNIDTAVQQNAALVEETAATAEELGNMAKMMNKNVSQFVIDESISSGDLQTGDFDFEAARRGHRHWKVKARAYINDVDVSFDQSTADNPSACPLGNWVYGDGQRYNNLPSFQALEREHAEFHAIIGRIIQHKDLHDIELANKEMDEFVLQSEIVIEKINQLERELNGGETMLQQPALTQSKPVKTAKTAATPASAPAKKVKSPAPDKSSGLQKPAPVQEKNDSNEWSDF